MIKVMIVDDSALIRKLLSDILKTDPDIEIVGTARNGEDALKKIEKLKPDVITLDVEMPIMDGLTTLKYLTRDYDIPVVMISTLTEEGADLTLKALEKGAVDFLQKPTNVFGLSEDEIKEEIVDKVKTASKVKVNRKVLRKSNNIIRENKLRFNKSNTAEKVASRISSNTNYKTIIAIGTSTGGPRALQTVIPSIPKDIDASIVIVQHMPAKFTKSLADRIDAISQIKVKEAEDREVLLKGWAYIAPGDYHMEIVIESGKPTVKLNQKPKVMGLRPTVDNLMNSVSKIDQYSKMAVILTGMGNDGAIGIKEMKRAKAYTIAQDEESSVVFGMPRAAIETGVVDEIVKLENVADSIVKNLEV